MVSLSSTEEMAVYWNGFVLIEFVLLTDDERGAEALLLKKRELFSSMEPDLSAFKAGDGRVDTFGDDTFSSV